MLSVGELYVLNRAIDGKGIYGMKSFNKYLNEETNLLDINLNKDKLIKKGLLIEGNKLSLEGASVIRRLERYKRAKGYLRIQDKVIAIENNNYGTIIRQVNKDSYTIEYMDISNIEDIMIKKYPFLLNKSLKDSRKLTPRESFILYYLKSEDGFLIEGIKNNKTEGSYLFMSIDNESYIYNRGTKVLEGNTLEKFKEIIGKFIY